MDTLRESRTVAVKPCVQCAGGLLDYDKFCRWCGVRQPEPAISSTLGASHHLNLLDHDNPGQTERLCKRVSGPLIDAMIQGMSSGAPGQARGSIMRAAILALVSLPMWLMIVLLSPLDAYAAARSLVRQL